MTTKETNLDLDALETENSCIHHWIIGAPSGPMSVGKCRNCGIFKEFKNSFDGSTWGSDVSLEQLQRTSNVVKSGGFGQIADRLKEEDNF